MSVNAHTPTPEVRAAAQVRQATFEDYPQIAAVQRRNGLEIRPRESWTALWLENPAWRRWGEEWPCGWVLEDSGGEVVGSISNIPFAYRFKGRDLTAAASCGWAVDPSARGGAMKLLASLMEQKRADFLISTTVNDRSEPLYRGFGWTRAPVGEWDRTGFWITEYPGFLSAALRMKGVPLAGASAYPLAAALKIRDWFRNGKPRTPETGFEVRSEPAIDGRFDEFWRALESEKQDVLLAVRSSEALAWHFGPLLALGKTRILTASKSSRMVAYAVFERRDNESIGLNRMRLVDFQGVSGSEGALEALLFRMLAACAEEGVHALETVGGWLNIANNPRLAPPYARRMSSWAYYYRPCRPELAAILSDPAAWAPSSFDGDASM